MHFCQNLPNTWLKVHLGKILETLRGNGSLRKELKAQNTFKDVIGVLVDLESLGSADVVRNEASWCSWYVECDAVVFCSLSTWRWIRDDICKFYFHPLIFGKLTWQWNLLIFYWNCQHWTFQIIAIYQRLFSLQEVGATKSLVVIQPLEKMILHDAYVEYV